MQVTSSEPIKNVPINDLFDKFIRSSSFLIKLSEVVHFL